MRSWSRERIEAFRASLTAEEVAALKYRWEFWARDNQLPPGGSWSIWLVLAGRGFGKTRTGAEWVRRKKGEGCRRMALVAPTAADVRDTMIEGESGLLAVSPPWDRPKYEPSKRRVTWKDGAVAIAYSADEPDRLRGPQHDAAWGDETASWPREAYDMLQFGLRLGANPQQCHTTTPRPVPLIRQLLARATGGDGTVAVTRGSSYENRENLPAAYFEQVIAPYEGSRMGRQEIHAEILEDTPGALWTTALIERTRVAVVPRADGVWEGLAGLAGLAGVRVPLVRVVVALDPSAGSEEGHGETGIVAVGRGSDGHGYVLADRSLRGKPHEWAGAAVGLFDELRADRLVAEKNNGGEMIRAVLETVRPNLPITLVWASRGKQTRAEPVASLYEQNKMHHVGVFRELEAQMATWQPGLPSPDRMDALVWGASENVLPVAQPARAVVGGSVPQPTGLL